MLATVYSGATHGVDAYPVETEVDVAGGIPAVIVVGLPDAAVRESRDRVKTAIQNSGFAFPEGRLTINLAEEVRGYGIAVNALAPGLVATEMTDGAGDPPERVVPAALWLLSHDASQFTGRVVARGEFGATWGEGVSGA